MSGVSERLCYEIGSVSEVMHGCLHAYVHPSLHLYVST